MSNNITVFLTDDQVEYAVPFPFIKNYATVDLEKKTMTLDEKNRIPLINLLDIEAKNDNYMGVVYADLSSEIRKAHTEKQAIEDAISVLG